MALWTRRDFLQRTSVLAAAACAHPALALSPAPRTSTLLDVARDWVRRGTLGDVIAVHAYGRAAVRTHGALAQHHAEALAMAAHVAGPWQGAAERVGQCGGHVDRDGLSMLSEQTYARAGQTQRCRVSVHVSPAPPGERDLVVTGTRGMLTVFANRVERYGLDGALVAQSGA